MYDFTEQLSKGEQAEKQLDEHFATWFTIHPVTRAQQRMGIDRMYTHKRDGWTIPIEYKTDWTAGKTGNAFVETISVDTEKKPGWAYTSRADVLIYFIPKDLLAYWIRFVDLRKELPRWCADFPMRKIPNKGYHTHGRLVPLDEFEKLARHVISL